MLTLPPSGKAKFMNGTHTIWSMHGRASDALEVYLCGAVDFASFLELQERLVYEVSDREDTLGRLLICEHPPIVTIGREGSHDHLLAPRAEFTSRQMEIRWLNRGGGAIVHQPGQVAFYPIIPLERLGLSVVEYRDHLELAVCRMAREFRVPAFRHPEEAGVFGRGGQFAFTGAAVKYGVSYHGLFVNVAPALDLTRMVRSNRSGCRLTSLAAERVQPISMHAVRESLMRHLAELLGYQRQHLYTGHPLLVRTKRRVYVST